MSEKYEFEKGMGEISGLGGGYEQACRNMLKAGLEYWDSHPNLDPKFRGFKGVYGLLNDDNEDVKALSKATIDATDDCIGAMHQAVIGSVLWIRKNGWVEYVKVMKKERGLENERNK